MALFKNFLSNVLLRGNKLPLFESVRHFNPNKREGSVVKDWLKFNDKIFPPQSPNEPRRPAYVVNAKANFKYSHKKLWYIACLVRGMTVDEAIKQLKFVQKKGAQIVMETILKAQQMAVEEHNVEFKSNLWVSESFVGIGKPLKGNRRCAKRRMVTIKSRQSHYFVTLEEGTPPEHYYYFRRPKSGQEMLEEWLQSYRNRKIINSL